MRRSSNRIVGIIAGTLLVVLGAVGFTVTAGTEFFDLDGALLFEFLMVNNALNLLHIAFGAVLILAALLSVTVSRRVNAIVGALFLALGIFGVFVVPGDLNVFAINGADNVVHLGFSVLLLAVGLGAERPTRSAG